MVAEHGAELLDACLDLFCSVMDHNELFVGLHIGCDGTGTHVAVMTEDRISHIVIVRSLDIIEKYDILQLYGVSYHALAADKSRASYECAVSDFSLRSYDAWSTEVSTREHLSCLVDPYVLADLFIFFRVKRRTKFKYEILDSLQRFPRICKPAEVILR